MKASKIPRSLRKIISFRPEISSASLMRFIILALIFILAFCVRILPIRWGYYLNEFDPYYHYRQTKYIIQHGLLGDKGWASWHDYLSWYPWGNEISRHAYPGLPVLAATIYMILNALKIPIITGQTLDPLQSDPVYVLCVMLPVIMGSVTCIVMYFLGRDLGGEAVGMLAALFLALDSSYIGRTCLGFFDDESVGILSILLFIFFFNRSIERKESFGSLKNVILSSKTILSILAGLTLGYLCASWGASRYVIAMTAIFAFTLLVLGRYSPRLLLSYAITFFIAISIASCVPQLKSRFPFDYLGTRFNFEYENIAVYVVFFLLLFAEIQRRARTRTEKIYYSLTIITLLVLFLLLLWWTGKISSLGAKFMAVLNPSVRFGHPLVESVAEHKPSAWGTFYYNFGIAVFFFPVGLFFATIMATNLSIFAIIYGLTSVFAASSMIRLNILMSSPISLFSALAIVHLLKPFVLSLRETEKPIRRRNRLRRFFGKETAMGILILMFTLLLLAYVVGTDFVASPTQRRGPRFYLQAYSPTTISCSGLSARPTDITRDWLNALTWVRLNTPPSPSRPGEAGTVIASWWDYGYWITAIANRTSLADNGTWNLTQIKQIGLMFMSNEEEAIKILKRFNVTHVIVFTTFDTRGRIAMAGGDEGKWQWMARIPGLDDKIFGNYTLGWDWIDLDKDGRPDSGEIRMNEIGQNTTLYKLMTYGREMTLQGYSSVHLKYFEKAYFSQEYGSLHPAPGTQDIIPLVCVYKVNYPSE